MEGKKNHSALCNLTYLNRMGGKNNRMQLHKEVNTYPITVHINFIGRQMKRIKPISQVRYK